MDSNTILAAPLNCSVEYDFIVSISILSPIPAASVSALESHVS